MSRIPKELRIYVEDTYAPIPKGKRPQVVRINDRKWGRFERNRIRAQEAYQKAGSPRFGELPVSAWITVHTDARRYVPSMLGVAAWWHGVVPEVGGRVIAFSARIRPAVADTGGGVEVIIKREDV